MEYLGIGKGTTRAEDSQGTPARTSPSIQVYEDQLARGGTRARAGSKHPLGDILDGARVGSLGVRALRGR